ncbi:MAG: UDP-N-acetylglucosamine--N-acetylmuramyl-(pentapeptide) pyrophosphoryl-undecaprenol N-acetylglucosamine transferase, partial [Syntrophales bacterium]|nr:UDP-N-acetylglucosamine--N-acetylmuramyl-(pentapeptide) pyrophosphoryl-undecaprenol N-acetylglucosamine transferase [Syntrophales bacterium]
ARYGFAWEAIASRALKGQGLWGKVRTLGSLPASVGEAVNRLRALGPDLVLGMGGYASGPVGVGAYLLGLPLAIHEQNAIPGVANRWLAKLAGRIFTSFPDTGGHFPRERAVWTGNPIRGEFFAARPERPASPFTVLLMGGSQGAHSLNMAALAALPLLADLKDRLAFLHITGDQDREEVAAAYDQAGFSAQVADFTPEVPAWMAQAHLVVCRAGASTLAELTALGRGALLVPFPFAANNHQEFNARFLAEKGAAELILNKDFTGEVLADKIKMFISSPDSIGAMETASRSLAKPAAAKEIVRGCLELINSPV